VSIQGVHEERDRQQISATARAQTAGDEGSMHRRGSRAPLLLLDTTPSEEPDGVLLSELQAGGAAAM
jgi:hypothetical protein